MNKFIEAHSGKILPIGARPGMGTTALALQIADTYIQNTDKVKRFYIIFAFTFREKYAIL